jgi:hypothetical protein
MIPKPHCGFLPSLYCTASVGDIALGGGVGLVVGIGLDVGTVPGATGVLAGIF